MSKPIYNINKPDKLKAAILFLSISCFIGLLNLSMHLWLNVTINTATNFSLDSWLISSEAPVTSVYLFIYWRIIIAIDLVWLIYEICKGNNWSRFYILFYKVIILVFLIVNFSHHYENHPIFSLHILIHIIFMLLGLFLLFHKDTSNWFKQIKQMQKNKYKLDRNIGISSILLYSAFGIGILNFVVFSWSRYFENQDFYYINIYIKATELVVIGTLNILFIHSIRKGSKLSGIIYYAIIVFAPISNFTPLHDSIAYIKSFNYSWDFLGFIQAALQVAAFILLFQKDIRNLFSRLLQKGSC